MADFCQQCSIEVWGKDMGDLAGITSRQAWSQGRAVVALCEGCGPVQVDPKGRRVGNRPNPKLVEIMETIDFVRESNRIEGINSEPTQAEIDEHNRFVDLSVVEVADLEQFVSVYQPGAKLRTSAGQNVRIGQHFPPSGGPHVREALQKLLDEMNQSFAGYTMTPYKVHVAYETLHPFTDGNGRSGRVLWAWQMTQIYGGYPLGFLHHFYYQALGESR